jgi:hypothetical protein
MRSYLPAAQSAGLLVCIQRWVALVPFYRLFIFSNSYWAPVYFFYFIYIFIWSVECRSYCLLFFVGLAATMNVQFTLFWFECVNIMLIDYPYRLSYFGCIFWLFFVWIGVFRLLRRLGFLFALQLDAVVEATHKICNAHVAHIPTQLHATMQCNHGVALSIAWPNI